MADDLHGQGGELLWPRPPPLRSRRRRPRRRRPRTAIRPEVAGQLLEAVRMAQAARNRSELARAGRTRPPDDDRANDEGEPVTPSVDREALDSAVVVARKVRLGLALSIRETALWFGGDRGTVAKHLQVVPMGSPARVPVGRIPARQVGSRRLVLPGDVLGCGHAPAGAQPGNQEECHGQDHDQAPAATSQERRDFDRSIDQLRHR